MMAILSSFRAGRMTPRTSFVRMPPSSASSLVSSMSTTKFVAPPFCEEEGSEKSETGRQEGVPKLRWVQTKLLRTTKAIVKQPPMTILRLRK